MPIIEFDKSDLITGLPPGDALRGSYCWVAPKGVSTSDEPIFYLYLEFLSKRFLNSVQINHDSINSFLLLQHEDGKTHLYFNDSVPVVLEIMPVRAIKKGEVLTASDICDIRQLSFPHITISPSDRFICCLKVKWKFMLYFDVHRHEPDGAPLDIDALQYGLGSAYRSLAYQYVYNTLQSADTFDTMLDDGWFPFAELIKSDDFKLLQRAYEGTSDLNMATSELIRRFTRTRVQAMTDRWWKRRVFNDKKTLLTAGLDSFFEETDAGVINCIKTLSSELYGILTMDYLVDQDKSARASKTLTDHIYRKGRDKAGSDESLLFPLHFKRYLDDVVFPRFNLNEGKPKMSRHTATHGVADVSEYTRDHALQFILALDQIAFFLPHDLDT